MGSSTLSESEFDTNQADFDPQAPPGMEYSEDVGNQEVLGVTLWCKVLCGRKGETIALSRCVSTIS